MEPIASYSSPIAEDSPSQIRCHIFSPFSSMSFALGTSFWEVQALFEDDVSLKVERFLAIDVLRFLENRSETKGTKGVMVIAVFMGKIGWDDRNLVPPMCRFRGKQEYVFGLQTQDFEEIGLDR